MRLEAASTRGLLQKSFDRRYIFSLLSICRLERDNAFKVLQQTF